MPATKLTNYQANTFLKSQYTPSKTSTKTKRSNSGFWEEQKTSNFERECIEERCDKEEFNEAVIILHQSAVLEYNNFLDSTTFGSNGNNPNSSFDKDKNTNYSPENGKYSYTETTSLQQPTKPLPFEKFKKQQENLLYNKCFVLQDTNNICTQYGSNQCINTWNDYKCKCNKNFEGRNCDICKGTNSNCQNDFNKVCRSSLQTLKNDLSDETETKEVQECLDCYQADGRWKSPTKFNCAIRRDNLGRLTNDCECNCKEDRFKGPDCNICKDSTNNQICQTLEMICVGTSSKSGSGSGSNNNNNNTLNSPIYDCRTCYLAYNKDPNEWDCQPKSDDTCDCKERPKIVTEGIGNSETVQTSHVENTVPDKFTTPAGVWIGNESNDNLPIGDKSNQNKNDNENQTNQIFNLDPNSTSNYHDSDNKSINGIWITAPIIIIVLAFLIYMLRKEARSVRGRPSYLPEEDKDEKEENDKTEEDSLKDKREEREIVNEA